MELIRVAFLKGNIERFGLMCQRKKEITIYAVLFISFLRLVQVSFGAAPLEQDVAIITFRFFVS
jgi:hypothetical protein